MFLYILVRTIHVVGLNRQHFLQGVGRAVRLKCPHFHLTEALTTKLRLTAQRLLGNKAVEPVERACILSSTRWFSFSMYM